MNVSKRTWILLGVAILAILAAFASLYFEKEEEIKTLESIEPDPIKIPRTKVVKEEVKTETAVTEKINDNGNEQSK
jgi:hypothetical protein